MIIILTEELREWHLGTFKKDRKMWVARVEKRDGEAWGNTMPEALGKLILMAEPALQLDDDDGNLTGKYLIEVSVK